MSDFSEMESLGEEKVRLKLASLEWEGTQALRAREWLEMKATRRMDAVDRRAWIAIIIATIAAAKEIKWLIDLVMSWLQ